MKTIKRSVSLLLVLAALFSLFAIQASAASMEDVTAYFAGKTIVLKSVQNGKFLSAVSSSKGVPLKAKASNGSTWEKFTVSAKTSDGWVGLKAHNGKYLSAMINTSKTPVQAQGGSLQSWECFRIYRCGQYYYLKAKANGKWLCTHVDVSGAPVRADASAASTWERYTIQICQTPDNSGLRYPVRYVEKTLQFDCSSFNNWQKSFSKGLMSLKGLIVGQKVLAWKTLKIKVPYGPQNGSSTYYVTETVKVPSKVTFQLHTHERNVGYGRSFRYADGCIITMYSCNCGLSKDLVVWEIPLPDSSDAQTTQSVINWLPQNNK